MLLLAASCEGVCGAGSWVEAEGIACREWGGQGEVGFGGFVGTCSEAVGQGKLVGSCG